VRFWVGGYGADGGGAAEGIGVLHAGEADSPWASGPLGMGPLAARVTGSPSWLAPHPTLDVVYAALEGTAEVQAFRRTGETTLEPLGGRVAVGQTVCHVGVSPDGGFLVASAWGDGQVFRVDLDAAGRPGRARAAAAATDPYGDGAEPGGAASAPAPDLAAAARALREAAGDEYAHLVPAYDDEASATSAAEGAVEAETPERVSRAHQATFLPGGMLATTDLGFDLVRFWRPSPDGLRPVQEVALPKGVGPRHAVWHPSGHLYVLTEYSVEVFVLAPDREGRWSVLSGAPLIGGEPGDTGAELTTSRDAATLYAGVRGSDTLGVLRVQGAGESLGQLALVASGVRWPRHHVVVRDTVLVAGQLGDEIASLGLDDRTGVPGRVRSRTATPAPSHLLPFR
jgi:6-phosphogluconolactonase